MLPSPTLELSQYNNDNEKSELFYRADGSTIVLSIYGSNDWVLGVRDALQREWKKCLDNFDTVVWDIMRRAK